MSKNIVKLSKFISLILRHKPDRFGLTLEEGGWLHIDELIAAAQRINVPLDRETLEYIVTTSDKQRFTLSQDGQRIRASHGHSLPVDLGLEPTWPPQYLYHGTAIRFLPSIQQHGLTSRGRQSVHLSTDEVTARQIGRRHGKPVVLTVTAEKMALTGFLFYHTASGIWLTSHVPPEHLTFPTD